MVLDITEQVGEFTVIEHGEVLGFGNEDIKLTLYGKEDSPLKMCIKFVEDEKKVGDIDRNVDGDVLTLSFYFYKTKFTFAGIPRPIEVGTSNMGRSIYFNCSVNFIDSTEGYLIFRYSFWEKEDDEK